MKKKEDKAKDLDSLKKDFQEAPHVFVTGFEKLTVAQDYELRKAVKGAGGNYKVIKNNLAQIAAKGTASDGVFDKVAGMTSIAYTSGDPVALAKVLTAYAKANPTLSFKAGVVEGRAVDINAIQDLANLPPREEILAKLLFMIQAPAQRAAMVVNAAGRNLAVVIDQAVKENKLQA